MNSLPKISALPLELSSKILQPFAQEREPVICLQIPSVGNFTPFRMRGRTNRSYRFEWDRKSLCHVLRIPASLWRAENAMLAKDIFQQTLMRPVIPVVEQPAPDSLKTELQQASRSSASAAPEGGAFVGVQALACQEGSSSQRKSKTKKPRH